jgi:anti-anti-sigma factor
MDRAEPAKLESKSRNSAVAALSDDLREPIAETRRAYSEGFAVAVTRPTEDVYVFALAGELDMASASDLEKSFSAVSIGGRCRVIVELSRLTVIDSTGIKALLRFANDVRERGATLLLAAPTAHVSHVFEITGLEAALPLSASLDAALRQGQAGEPAAAGS